MRGFLAGLAVAALLGVATPAFSQAPLACARAAAVAERRWALPKYLLLAIGQVESGRRDEGTGAFQPWPWSANAAGSPFVLASAAEARAVVGFLQERGVVSIDIGCFQVNLRHHPLAFANVAEGFDPYANADYAARFLRGLFARSGSWLAAIADYHSGEPELGSGYRGKVLRAWHALRADAAPLSRRGGDPHVVLLAAAAPRAIPVYTPQTLPPALRPALGLALPRAP